MGVDRVLDEEVEKDSHGGTFVFLLLVLRGTLLEGKNRTRAGGHSLVDLLAETLAKGLHFPPMFLMPRGSRRPET